MVAGITWLVSLFNPAGAFIKACKAIYDVIMFFIERGSQIMALVNAVLNSVSAIASGSVGGGYRERPRRGLARRDQLPRQPTWPGRHQREDQEHHRQSARPGRKAVDWVIGKAVAGLKKVGGLFTGKGKGKNPDPSKDAAKGTAPGQNAAHDKGKGDTQNQDPNGKNVKAEVRSDLGRGRFLLIGLFHRKDAKDPKIVAVLTVTLLLIPAPTQ